MSKAVSSINVVLHKAKTTLQNLSEESHLGKSLYRNAKYGLAGLLAFLDDEQYAKWFYHLYTKKELDLKNPVTFDQKLWWLKLYNRDPLLTKCSDKYAVRDYVADQGYRDILIEIFDVIDHPKEIDFNKYKVPVIIKCTNGSGVNHFYIPGKDNDSKWIRKELLRSMKRNPYLLSREWNYKNIKAKIIIEKVLFDSNGKLPFDYKFMCFDGEPKLLFMSNSVTNSDYSYSHQHFKNVYDMNFKLLPIREPIPNSIEKFEKPQNFERMVEIAKNLSAAFPHCRVDLYNVDGAIYFGEITFYHGGGCNHITPYEWELKMGEWIDINSEKIKLEMN